MVQKSRKLRSPGYFCTLLKDVKIWICNFSSSFVTKEFTKLCAKRCKIQISNFSLNFITKEFTKLCAERCKIWISNFSLSFVVREFAKLWWFYVNLMPFSCKNQTNFAAFPVFLCCSSRKIFVIPNFVPANKSRK